MIKVKGLSKSFGNKQVLKGIDLEFEKAKIYGIVGENGAGKTTLFRCLAGLEKYEGEIESDLSPLKNHLGLLLAEPFFFSKITGLEYLQLLCKARGVKESAFEEKNIFDLPLKQYASTYSTGMKKKLALLAILLQKNEYFILDEPFNGVDLQSNMILKELFLKLKQGNKTILISSHIFGSLREICDEIHFLKDGLIQRSVKPAEFDQLENELKGKDLNRDYEKLGLD